MFGIYIGAYGTKVVKEVFIRLVTAVIILLCVLSRLIAVPVYLQQLGYLDFDSNYNEYFNTGSKAMLYVSGIAGCGLILFFVFRAYFQRRKIQASITAKIPGTTVKDFASKT